MIYAIAIPSALAYLAVGVLTIRVLRIDWDAFPAHALFYLVLWPLLWVTVIIQAITRTGPF